MTPAQWLAGYRERDKAVGSVAECQWRMLCDLAVNGSSSVTSVCIAGGAPATTALRHLGEIERAGLVAAEGDPFDGRRRFISLTDAGRSFVGGA